MIVLTSDADFVYVTFPVGYHGEWEDVKLKRMDVRSVCKCVDDGGVEVVFQGGESFILEASKIASIDGDLSITTNVILHSKLKDLMKA